MGRLNYALPDSVHRRAKMAADWQGVTLRQFGIEALRQAITAGRTTPPEGSRRTQNERGGAQWHYEVPDDVHRGAKGLAAMQGITLKQFLTEALERATVKPLEQRDKDRSSRRRAS